MYVHTNRNYYFLCVCLKEINTFIQQGCIKLMKNGSEDSYNVTKDF